MAGEWAWYQVGAKSKINQDQSQDRFKIKIKVETKIKGETKIKVKIRIKIKGGGLECPPHTNLFLWFVVVQDFGDDVVDDFIDAFVGQVEVIRQNGKCYRLAMIRRGISRKGFDSSQGTGFGVDAALRIHIFETIG
jgi:hypothetical protein